VTLHLIDNLEQGSDAWLDMRRGLVTASVVGQLITAKTVKPASNDYSRALTLNLVAERITGHTEPVFVNADMMRGNMDEPIARDAYSRYVGKPVEEIGFMVRDDRGVRIGYSPDGLVGNDGLIEIKSRRAKKHLSTILTDEVPLENMAQIQTGLMVSGRSWLDYVSFCGGLPLYVKRVFPDERWFIAIVAAVTTFEQNASQMVATFAERTAGMPLTERIDYFPEASL